MGWRSFAVEDLRYDFAPARALPRFALVLAAVRWQPPARLTFAEAQSPARDQAPALLAPARSTARSQPSLRRHAARPAPEPRFRTTCGHRPRRLEPDARDFMTMQRIGLMQEVPNRAKREARGAWRPKRVQRRRRCSPRRSLPCSARRRSLGCPPGLPSCRAAEIADLERGTLLLRHARAARRFGQGDAGRADDDAPGSALALADRRDEAKPRHRQGTLPRCGAGSARVLATARWRAGPDRARCRAAARRMDRHAESRRTPCQQVLAEAESEADAEQRGDWAWRSYSKRGGQYSDRCRCGFSTSLWQRDWRQRLQVAARRQEAGIEAERVTRRCADESSTPNSAELQAVDAQRDACAAQGGVFAAERVAPALVAWRLPRRPLAFQLRGATPPRRGCA